ncbi:MAG: GH92 family glycosyl hydrolase [Saprospiraceae bacterium]
MKKYFLLLTLWAIAKILQAQTSNTQFVNPYIGTGGHGHTFPGVSAPFGMVQLSPDTRLEGWDGCSGYHYTDSIVYGFSHTHLSGTGIPDYGDILLMPTSGKIRLNSGYNGKKGYRSSFKKANEKCTTSNFKTYLDDYGIAVSLMATEHCGYHIYNYTKKEAKNVILDLLHRDQVLEADFKLIDPQTVQGYRFSKAWAKDQRVYFYIRFSSPVKLKKTISKRDKNWVGAFELLDKTDNKLYVGVGISPVSIENAKLNYQTELQSSLQTKAATIPQSAAEWEKILSSVQIETDNIHDKINFYTALYHNYQVPNSFQDVNGDFPGMDRKTYNNQTGKHYTVFSLWDTYRATHPLYTILQPARVNNFINTFLDDFDKSGALPMWELAGNETWCMIGNHAIPVIADAYLKGIKSFNATHALDAMIKSTEINHFGQKAYGRYGFVPAEMEHESVSKTIEYAYDDYCIAKMAKALGKDDVYQKYIRRAQNYKNVLNPENGFSQAKINQTWVKPFRADEVNSHFTEGNSWHYTFSAPHDMSTWMQLIGGASAAEAKLDALFAADSKTSGREQVDISGLIGQYAHGNEPSHHIAYLYNFVGKPSKTQAIVHQIMNEFYKNQPDGLIGNEDCGQMSAWYIFSAMGFYPVNPCGGQYVIGTPRFPSLKINLENGKIFGIKAINLSDVNFYIQSATLNGLPLQRSWISHEEIMNGGELVFTMGNKPSTWATKKEEWPQTEIKEYPIIPAPFVARGEKSFKNSTTVELANADKNAKIAYFIPKSNKKDTIFSYTNPIQLNETTDLYFRIQNKDSATQNVWFNAKFTKVPFNRKLTLKYKYANQYAAGGNNALIDFIRGGKNYHTGEWQGYEGVDCEAIIDLEKQEDISTISVGILQDQNAWIFAPLEIQTYISQDGVHFEHLKTIKNELDEKVDGCIVREVLIKKEAKARYLKVVAKNRGLCPKWHPGAAEKGKAWIFLDEITVE